MSFNVTDRLVESQARDLVNASKVRDWHFRRSWFVSGVVVIMFLGVGLGVGLGRLAQESAGSESSYVAGNTVVSGNDLTERQIEMVEVAARYVDAWIEKNGDAVASFMVPSGSVDFPTLGNRTVRADDGTLQDWVENIGQFPNELNDPMVVEGNRVVLIGQFLAYMDWMISIEFTTSGDVMIVSDTHWAW